MFIVIAQVGGAPTDLPYTAEFFFLFPMHFAIFYMETGKDVMCI